jgi:hypothetical protein
MGRVQGILAADVADWEQIGADGFGLELHAAVDPQML